MTEITTSPARAEHPVSTAMHLLVCLLLTDDEHGGLSPGDKAELRRMDPAGVLPPAAWRLLSQPRIEDGIAALGGGIARREANERAFAVLIGTMLEAGQSRPRPIGEALAKPSESDDPRRRQGYSKDRFIRLLRARGPAEVAHEARQAARWCKAKGAAFCFDDGGTKRNGFGPFLLDAALDHDAPAERRAHAIARDYFANLPPEKDT